MRQIALLLLLLPGIARAYATGPDNGYTGAPGEQNCTACHISYPLNSGDGALSISGPAFFHPGQTYPITVTLADPDQQRWGFELTTQGIGSCTITDPVNSQLATEFGNEYVKHTRTGTRWGVFDGPTSWTFDWTAPAEPVAAVTFYAAGNAANGNEDETLDYIYTTSLNIEAGLVAVTDLSIQFIGAAASLSWSAIPLAVEYRVEHSVTGYGPWLPLATVSTPGHLEPAPGAMGCYRVVALR